VNFRLIILPQAKEDLRRNAEWWAHDHSPEQAARWLDAIQSQLETKPQVPVMAQQAETFLQNREAPPAAEEGELLALLA